MEIRTTAQSKERSFDELQPGDIFIWNTIVFMKIEAIYAVNKSTINCVRLDNGLWTTYMTDKTPVEVPPQAYLTLDTKTQVVGLTPDSLIGLTPDSHIEIY